MKRILFTLLLTFGANSSNAESIPVSICKLVAENRKYWADLKAMGFKENKIRDEIFQKNIEYKKVKIRNFTNLPTNKWR